MKTLPILQFFRHFAAIAMQLAVSRPGLFVLAAVPVAFALFSFANFMIDYVAPSQIMQNGGADVTQYLLVLPLVFVMLVLIFLLMITLVCWMSFALGKNGQLFKGFLANLLKFIEE